MNGEGSYVLLADAIEEIEDFILCAGLGLKLIDRVGPLTRCVPTELLHKGVTVRPGSTVNTGQYRDQEVARVQDNLLVEMAYQLTPMHQRTTRNEALVLEAQIRRILTGETVALSGRLRYTGTTSRDVHPADTTWWITTMTYTFARDALLGG